MTYNPSFILEVDSGEFLAEVEVVCSPGCPGDWYTPAESPSWELDSGWFSLYDDESGDLLPERFNIDKLSPEFKKFLERDIESQLASFIEDAFDPDYDPIRRIRYYADAY